MQDSSDNRNSWLSLILDPRWIEIIARAWRLGRKIFRGLTNEGIYEVIDYECQVELKDQNGNLATIKKREKIRYLQDYITSYQDRAWGDGEIFLNYRCSRGTPVDEFRLGHKTYKLISLREFRNQGDVDDFQIEWNLRRGFLKSTGFWGTGINHRTRKVTVKVVFPKDRPPKSAAITESNLQRTRNLGQDVYQLLPDGRKMILWEVQMGEGKA